MFLKHFFLLTISSLLLFTCVKAGVEKVIEREQNINEMNNENTEFKESQSVFTQLDISDESHILEIVDSNLTQETIDEYMLNTFSESQEVEMGTEKFYFLALGDSLTRGVGDEQQKNGYTKRLAEKIKQWSKISDVELDNRGKRGRRSDQLLALLEKGHYDNELKNSRLITITIGGNDMMKVVKKDIFDIKKEDFDKELVKFQERYDQIIKEIRLRNPNVPIILIGLYNPFSIMTDEFEEFDTIISEWNNTIQDVSGNYANACFVNVEDLFETNANLVYHTDFFHPNGNGYTIMTERIVSNMKNCQIEDPSNGLILFH